jgi:chorismate lyase/3-hydroxybenzoate synthase
LPTTSLRLVQLGHARCSALLRAASADARAAAFDRAFPGALGAACFGDAARWPVLADAAPDLPLAPVHMATLAPAAGHPAIRDAACFEIWQCDARDLKSARRGALHYRHSESAGLVFGSIALHEADFARVCMASGRSAGDTPLERATHAAYRELFSLLDELGTPHPLRIWNTVPAINAEQFGIERYRQFNIGRQRAFEACRRALTGGVPAACALGSATSVAGDGAPALPLAVYFLASRAPSDAIDNPRQVSAYHYPKQYGPRAPTFARAAVWSGADAVSAAPVLFVSGTASIVRHQTVHHGDVAAQTRETLANIAAVLEQAARQGHRKFALPELTYKVYVRDSGDTPALAAIDRALREAAGPSVRPLYLHADVCRADLLLEIEASAGHLVEAMS